MEPVAPAQRADDATPLDELQRRAHAAERKAANLERALVSNRRIGIAVGVLMCRHDLTADEAFAMLLAQSQRCNVKLREVAEVVIRTRVDDLFSATDE